MIQRRVQYWAVFLLMIVAGCRSETTSTGWLAGHVTIGPLSPVVQEGVQEITPAPEVYAGRQVVVFEAGGRQEVLRAAIDPAGNYRVELPAGSYVVDINHSGIDFAKGLPAAVEVLTDQETRLDIDIDTGIR